ncbi:MDR efflux pump AcrAB transcriptional activator RobA, partial [Escherichia coli]|nr:MDR efflux pump AcrAB transcriptional activator RobA [Escherichia coli]
EWCSDGICSAILLDDVPMPEHEFVTLPPRTVTGIENSCSHRLEDWATACTHMRQEFWLHHISVAKTIPDYVYGLYSTTRNPDKEDEQTVHYTTAV